MRSPSSISNHTLFEGQTTDNYSTVRRLLGRDSEVNRCLVKTVSGTYGFILCPNFALNLLNFGLITIEQYP
ncbi:hypothetical protein GCM10007916_22780 [Psychromonas marina]|uniref:Uncharacterized protein n=1 Tax=Psychromonas marina TaxID=88364 RepID=A0ABQ6E1T6_9GAMM|nr:hypothetical protein GCM10007916_22780 [Psychromonas marina]